MLITYRCDSEGKNLVHIGLFALCFDACAVPKSRQQAVKKDSIKATPSLFNSVNSEYVDA